MYFFHFRFWRVATYLGPFFWSKEKKTLEAYTSKSLLAPIWLFSNTLLWWDTLEDMVWVFFWAAGKLFFVGSKLRCVTSTIIQRPRSLFNIQQYIIAGGKQYINANICFWPPRTLSTTIVLVIERARLLNSSNKLWQGWNCLQFPVTTFSIWCWKVLQFQFDDKWIVIIQIWVVFCESLR